MVLEGLSELTGRMDGSIGGVKGVLLGGGGDASSTNGEDTLDEAIEDSFDESSNRTFF